MSFIINPFMGAAPAATMTHKYTVRLAVFDADDSCACTLGATQTWDDSYGASDGCGAGVHCYAIDDWVDDGTVCGQVTAINATATADSSMGYNGVHSTCSDCNGMVYQCSAGEPPP